MKLIGTREDGCITVTDEEFELMDGKTFEKTIFIGPDVSDSGMAEGYLIPNKTT